MDTEKRNTPNTTHTHHSRTRIVLLPNPNALQYVFEKSLLRRGFFSRLLSARRPAKTDRKHIALSLIFNKPKPLHGIEIYIE